MRSQVFLNTLSNVLTPKIPHNASALVKAEALRIAQPLKRAATLTSQLNIQGAWEVWLQVEIAFALLDEGIFCIREVAYPSTNQAKPFLSYHAKTNTTAECAAPRARCDFYLYRLRGNAHHNESFLELKCKMGHNTHAEAWGRYQKDLNKIKAVGNENPGIAGIALLATHVKPSAVEQVIEAYDTYVWDPTHDVVTRQSEMNFNDDSERFLFMAAAVRT